MKEQKLYQKATENQLVKIQSGNFSKIATVVLRGFYVLAQLISAICRTLFSIVMV